MFSVEQTNILDNPHLPSASSPHWGRNNMAIGFVLLIFPIVGEHKGDLKNGRESFLGRMQNRD